MNLEILEKINRRNSGYVSLAWSYSMGTDSLYGYSHLNRSKINTR